MILVVGATGTLGGRIARSLLDKGRTVRVLVRPHSDYRLLVEAGAQPVFGDLKDPASLEAACRGADTLITTANSALRGGEDNVQTVDLQGNRNLIDAARKAGVKHFIFTSALGVSKDSPVPFMQAKALTEEYLQESGMPFTILAPNAFMEVWWGMAIVGPALAGGPVVLVGSGNRKHSFVSVADVAAFAVAAVDNPAAINRYIVIGGPEPLSFRDAVSIYERALGKEIPIASVAPGEPVPGMDNVVLSLMAGFDMYDSPVDMAETAGTFGVTPTPLEQVVRRQVEELASPVG